MLSWEIFSKSSVGYLYLILVVSCSTDNRQCPLRKVTECVHVESRAHINYRFADLNHNVNSLNETSQGDAEYLATANASATVPIPGVVQPIMADEQYLKILENPLILYSLDWTNTLTGTATFTNDLFSVFMTGTNAITKKLANFRFMDAELEVKITVQGSSNAFGRLVIWADPTPKDPQQSNYVVNSFVSTPSFVRCQLIPHVVVDPSKSATYSMTLPCPTTWGVWQLTNPTADGSYRFGYTVLNTLGSATAAEAVCRVTTYVSLRNVKLSTLTFTSAEEERAPISGLLYATSSALENVSKLPIPEFSEKLSIMSSATRKMADTMSWFGFSKAPKPLDSVVGLNGSVQNFSLMDGPNVTRSLASRADNAIGLKTSNLQNADDQVLQKLAAKKGLVLQVPMSLTADDTVLFSVPIDPAYCLPGATDSTFEMTPVAFVTRFFKYWRGDMTVHIDVVASVFHRATLMFAYYPNYVDRASNYTAAPNSVRTWTVQVSGNTSVDLKIPWSQAQAFLPVGPLRPFNASTPYPYDGVFANGVLTCYTIAHVTSNGGTDPPVINVYFSCGDIKLGYPNNDLISGTRVLSPTLTANSLETESVTMGLSSDDKLFYKKFFGETPAHTVKEIANRYNMVYSTRDVGRTGVGFFKWKIATVPPFQSASAPGSGLIYQQSAFSLLSLAYIGHVGSWNYHWLPDSNQNVNSSSNTQESWTFATVGLNSGAVPGGINGAGALGDDGRAFMQFFGKISNTAAITIPYYHPGLYRVNYPIVSPSVSQEGAVFCINDTCQTSDSVYGYIWASLGDDGQFVFFRGIPLITQSGT